jgi:hypothetical protein
MGATNFACIARGKDAKEAFSNARSEALYDHGHSGYTGSIAEKNGFRLVTLTEAEKNSPNLFYAKIDELTDTEFSDKWGEAGCVKMKEDTYYFFGMASC